MRPHFVQSNIIGAIALFGLMTPVFAQSPAALPPTPSVPAVTSPAGLPPLTLPSVTPQTPTDAPPADAAQAALPAISALPLSPTGQPPVDEIAAPTPAAEKTYSYGDSNLSILFLPDQIRRMKEAIREFEDTGKDAAQPAPVVAVVAAPTAPEIIEDPLVYPTFYLASIAYDDAKDWTVWVSGYKITSRRNVTDITVLNITRDSVTFLWKPSFTKAIARRQKDKLFASADPVKHKLVAPQSAQFDAAAGSVIFTLKPNQTFAPGYFKTFEGYIDGPTLTALPVVVATSADGQPIPGQPVNPALDVNGNPINENAVADGKNFSPASTNFNPPSVPAN